MRTGRQFFRMEVIGPLGLSVTEAAKVLGVTRPALSALLNGRAALGAGVSDLRRMVLRQG
jgi:plasmid maintenance system antidote protein VapI